MGNYLSYDREKCRICGKPLSIYNNSGECYFHNEDPKNYGRFSSFEFYEFNGRRSGNLALHTQLVEEGRCSSVNL